MFRATRSTRRCPDLTGPGPGDPAAAKAALAAAGKLGFELSWYYDNTKPITQQVCEIRGRRARPPAGFKVKPIGVTPQPTSHEDLGLRRAGQHRPGPARLVLRLADRHYLVPGAVPDHSVADGTSWGMLQRQGARRARSTPSPTCRPTRPTAKWAALDQQIMGQYVALPLLLRQDGVCRAPTSAAPSGGDPTMGMPFFPNMFLKS